MSYQSFTTPYCFGNLIADSSNNAGMGGSVLILNSCNTTNTNNAASLAFMVANVVDLCGNLYLNNSTNGSIMGPYGIIDNSGVGTYIGNTTTNQVLNNGGYYNGLDYSDVRISAIINSNGGTDCVFYVASNPATGIPAEGLRIVSPSSGNPNVIAQGQISALSFNATSDYRMKQNVQALDISKTIDLLNPVEYDLLGGTHDMGFLAHEVQDIFPFLVSGVKDGLNNQSINYNGLIALLVKEIKDIKKRLSDTEETVRQLIQK
jgi:hypothetical protein